MRRTSPFELVRFALPLLAMPVILGAPAVLPGDAAAKVFVVPHVLEAFGTVANTQFTFDTNMYMTYGNLPGGPGLGSSVDMYLYNNNGTVMQSQTFQDVCNPCSYQVGAGNPSSAWARIDNLLMAAGGFAGAKTGFAVLSVGGNDPDAVRAVSIISNSHTSAFDLSTYYEPADEVATGGSNHRTFMIPHFLEAEGSISNTQFTFDTNIYATYVAGLGGLPAGPGATVDLYLIEDDGSTFVTGAQGDYVCAPCHYTLDGATRKQNINLDTRFLAAGGPGYGVKSGYALLDVNGDVDAVSLTAFVSNSHTSPFDLSITGLVPEEIIAPERLGVGPGPAGASAVRLAVAPNPTRTAGSGDRPVSLSFELPEAGAIELAIYDMSGRRVATPERGRFDAGAHRATWNGRDGSGNAVPPGIYFARIHHANGTTTSRIVAVH